VSCGALITLPVFSNTACSIMLRSSRTLPGQPHGFLTCLAHAGARRVSEGAARTLYESRACDALLSTEFRHEDQILGQPTRRSDRAATASTVFSGGLLADISVGTKLEAEGPISAGVLTAAKVSLRDNVRVEADVAGIDVVGKTLSLAGLPGVTVTVNSLTSFKGGATSIAALAAPNHLRTRGRLGAGNTIVATELEQRSTTSGSRVIVQAPVNAMSGTNNVTLLGSIVVTTSGVPESEFKNISDAPLGRAAFYAAIKVGSLVKARADLIGSALVWNQIEIED
jgi:hypothetical protein